MNRKSLQYPLIIVAVFVLFTTSCIKDDQNDYRALISTVASVPTITTKSISNITQNSATSGGEITADGGAAVITRGVCWSTSQNPTISDSKSNDGTGTGSFTSILSGLTLGTNYYVRAYAKNSAGVMYGSQKSFNTSSALIIGANYAGGIVFYIDTSGMHGLICADSNQSDSAMWGCPGVSLTGADIAAVGGGMQNTTDIIIGCTTVGIAADICYRLSLNGYNDWYLPSKEELRLMYKNLKLHSLGNFSNVAYWSSTEMTNAFAWQMFFDNGILQGSGKNIYYSIRAVRAF